MLPCLCFLCCSFDPPSSYTPPPTPCRRQPTIPRLASIQRARRVTRLQPAGIHQVNVAVVPSPHILFTCHRIVDLNSADPIIFASKFCQICHMRRREAKVQRAMGLHVRQPRPTVPVAVAALIRLSARCTCCLAPVCAHNRSRAAEGPIVFSTQIGVRQNVHKSLALVFPPDTQTSSLLTTLDTSFPIRRLWSGSEDPGCDYFRDVGYLCYFNLQPEDWPFQSEPALLLHGLGREVDASVDPIFG